jgi:archaellum component FlaC
MDEQDFGRIEKLFTRLSDEFDNKLEKQTEDYHRQINIVADGIDHKLGILADGQQMLCERMDRMDERLERVEVRLDSVEVKVDSIASDLSAHRADTEAHHGVYLVKEG